MKGAISSKKRASAALEAAEPTVAILNSRPRARLASMALPEDSFALLKATLGISDLEAAALLAIPRSTYMRKKHGPLDARIRERLDFVMGAVSAAERLFDGNRSALQSWMRRPALALGGAVPLEHCKSLAGIEEVKLLLERLEYGVVV